MGKVVEIEDFVRPPGRVVQCHGTFDVLHYGHMLHLSAAKKLGESLVVTVTSDRFVHKGPGRPLFPAHARAAMIAALECVDTVVVSDEESAVGVIGMVRPDVFVKGDEYEGVDVTGNFAREKQAVEATGGRVEFTGEETHSSTRIINSGMRAHTPEVKACLDKQDLVSLEAAIERMADLKVLLVGDTIIDVYNYVVPLNKPPKENVLAAHFKSKEVFYGGVHAAAAHLESFCKEVRVVTGAHRTLKSRYIDSAYMRKLFEVYSDVGTPCEMELPELSDFDVVISTDFGHGLIGENMVSRLCKDAKFLAVNTQCNAGNYGFNLVHKYPKADYVCIDEPEARLAVCDKDGPIEELRLPIDCDKYIITRGKNGCITSEKERLPALTGTVVDTIGAGDAFFAITAPLLAAGASLSQAAFIGNVAGALKVGILGHQKAVEKHMVIKSIRGLLG